MIPLILLNKHNTTVDCTQIMYPHPFFGGCAVILSHPDKTKKLTTMPDINTVSFKTNENTKKSGGFCGKSILVSVLKKQPQPAYLGL